MQAGEDSKMAMTGTVGEFSVCQFFSKDESYEYVRRGVSAEEAVDAAAHFTSSVGARMGIIDRVIITDGGDSICFEWKQGEGVTFPPREKAKESEVK
jgi:hypothetical protein